MAAVGFTLLDLVATSRTFKTTACSILSTDLETDFLLLSAPDRDALVFVATVVALTLEVFAATSFIGCTIFFLPGFALTAGLATDFTFFSVNDFSATCTFVFTAIRGDSTALFTGIFFAGLDTDFGAGLIALALVLRILPVLFLVAGFVVGFTVAVLTAGLARAVTTAFFGVIFFVLLADFAPVAFIVSGPQ